MKKLTSLLLAFVLCISCLGLTALAAGEELTAKYADGIITVEGKGFEAQNVTVNVKGEGLTSPIMAPAAIGADGVLSVTLSTAGNPIDETNATSYTVNVRNSKLATIKSATVEVDKLPDYLPLTVTGAEAADKVTVEANGNGVDLKDGVYNIPYADRDKVVVTVTSDKDVAFSLDGTELEAANKSASFAMTKAATLTVTLTPTRAIASIEALPGYKAEYKAGETFDAKDLKIKVTYTSGEPASEEVAYGDAMADFDFEPSLETALKVSDKVVTVTYKKDKTADLAITVKEVPAAPEFADDSWIMTAADQTTAEFTLKTAAPAGAIYTVYTDEKCTTKAEGVETKLDETRKKLTLSGVQADKEINGYYVTVKLAADGEESLGTVVLVYAYGTPEAPEFTATTATASTNNTSVNFTLKEALPEGAKLHVLDEKGNELTVKVDGTKATITFPSAITAKTQVKVCVESADGKVGEPTTLTVNKYTSGGGGSSGGGGGGGGGGSSSTVTKSTTSNGSYTLSNSSAKAGDSVKITPKANSGYEVDQITVTDKKGNAVAVTKNSDGTYSFTMPASSLQPVKTSVTFKKTESTSGGTSGGTTGGGTSGGSTSTGFSDVPADAYYAAAVKWAVDNKITTGTSESTFSPNADCTRAQAVTFLYRAAGSPAVSATSQFTDVNASDYFANAVAWAVANGITNGTGEGTFAPNAICTRAEIVTFLARYEKANTTAGATAFSDVADNDWYAGAVSWAVANNITTGTSSNTFSPKDSCTRAQIVTFLYRDMVK